MLTLNEMKLAGEVHEILRRKVEFRTANYSVSVTFKKEEAEALVKLLDHLQIGVIISANTESRS